MKLSVKTSRWLLGLGLGLAVGAAQAAGGVRVTPEQANEVKQGMNSSDVQQSLGRPEKAVKYMNQEGPTWTYEVVGEVMDPYSSTRPVLDVDFDANGRVKGVSKRVEPAGAVSGSGGHGESDGF